jgi:hypothetical protein
VKKILFLHDTSLSLLRGAELTINQLTGHGIKKGFFVETDLLEDFAQTCAKIKNADLVVINSSSRCAFEKPLLQHLIDAKIRYVKIEFDYNFCMRRTIQCTVDPEVRNCCDVAKFYLYRDLFARSQFCVFQSPRHYRAHAELFGQAVINHLIMPPTVDVDALQVSGTKDENAIPFFGDLSFLKGGQEYLDYASEHRDKEFVVYGKNRLTSEIPANIIFKDMVSNDKVLAILGQTKTFFCKPFWPEPSGRLAAEAFLSGCEIIANDRVGTFSFDFYPTDIERAKREMKETIGVFWSKVSKLFQTEKPKSSGLGKVLVKKTSGGIGDFFFCIPALYVLADVSDSVTFGVAARLVSFFDRHLPNIHVIDENVALGTEDRYDLAIELGNYPAYLGGFKLPNAIKYTAHKKVRQHATAHYIDAVAKLHRDCNVNQTVFPYFKKETDFFTPYYTLHAGAGMLLKTWPVQNFADLIRGIHSKFPGLRCKIIKGPDDPDPLSLFDIEPQFVEIITGGMNEVGEVMSGALFHIGNDSGITHVAGAFNVPTVGIYGPTGPGAWGSMAEHSQTVWGKPGNCDRICDSNVILTCENRVCLSSITHNQVMAKLYALLEKAYPQMPSEYILNPNLEIAYHDSICRLTFEGNEFDINFTDLQIMENVTKILSGDFSVAAETSMPEFVAFLREQQLLFAVPKIHLQQTKKLQD